KEKELDRYSGDYAYERSDDRHEYRNGYYDHPYFLSIGKIDLKVPRTRSGEFSTDVFEKYERCDQALILSMLEMVVNGVSTRKIANITKRLYGETVFKTTVSKLTEKHNPIVKEWANRNLDIQQYSYLFVYGNYIKVREEDKLISKAVYIDLVIKNE